MSDRPPTEQKDLIAEAAGTHHGLKVDEWREDPDGIKALFGEWKVTEEDEDEGLYEGDKGTLSASVVGARKHGNEHVAFYFTPEDWDEDSGGIRVTPFDNVEHVG